MFLAALLAVVAADSAYPAPAYPKASYPAAGYNHKSYDYVSSFIMFLINYVIKNMNCHLIILLYFCW